MLTALRMLGPPAPPDTLTVRFLDVGQGDATLVQHPDGSAVLFDGGPPEAGTARLLRRAGVRELTAVVATHASRDHHGGLAEVLDRFHVGVLLDGGDGTPDPTFRAMLAQAVRKGVRDGARPRADDAPGRGRSRSASSRHRRARPALRPRTPTRAPWSP